MKWKHWPWVLSGVVLSGATGAAVRFWSLPDLGNLGSYLSGVASAIAFIWLIAAYLQQGDELRMQRKELSLQRESLDQQRVELKKMGKYAALSQIEHMLEQFERSLVKPGEGVNLVEVNQVVITRPQSSADIPLAFMKGIGLWKYITESSSSHAVIENYNKWLTIETPARELVNRVVSAIELYEEATGEKVLPAGQTPAHRLYFATDAVMNLPFIRHYAGPAKMVATHMIITEPGLDLIQLRALEAIVATAPGVIDPKALAALRARVEARERERQGAAQKEANR